MQNSILRVLEGAPARWDVSSLRIIMPSDVIWTAETKSGPLVHNKRLIMIDSLGPSDAIWLATDTTTADSVCNPQATVQFTPGSRTRSRSVPG